MTRPVKVLKVCAIDSSAWLLLRPQMEAMRDHGWDVHVACSDGPYMERLRERGIMSHPIAIARNTDVFSHLRSIRELYKLIRRERFDVVHVHTPVAALIGRIAAKLAGVPLTLYTAHGFYFHDEMPAAQRTRHVLLERAFGKLTDHLFTQSMEDAETAVIEGIMPRGQVTVISNGVPIQDFQTVPEAAVEAWRTKLGIPADAVVIGIVGRIVEEKGFGEYFRAARDLATKFPNVAFLVVGGKFQGDRDTFLDEVERLVKDPVLEPRVFFSGYSEEIPALMNLMDVFALPSYREGMPRSIIEAMAAGKPVVATDIRGCREEVVEGETGYLVPTKAWGALAERLGRLLADPELRRQMGDAGRRRAEALFDERMVCHRLISTMDRLLAARGLAPAREASKTVEAAPQDDPEPATGASA